MALQPVCGRQLLRHWRHVSFCFNFAIELDAKFRAAYDLPTLSFRQSFTTLRPLLTSENVETGADNHCSPNPGPKVR